MASSTGPPPRPRRMAGVPADRKSYPSRALWHFRNGERLTDCGAVSTLHHKVRRVERGFSWHGRPAHDSFWKTTGEPPVLRFAKKPRDRYPGALVWNC